MHPPASESVEKLPPPLPLINNTTSCPLKFCFVVHLTFGAPSPVLNFIESVNETEVEPSQINLLSS